MTGPSLDPMNGSSSGEGDSLMSPQDNRRMFDSIARRYDLMNRILSLGLDRRWRRKAVAELDPCEGGCYLDVGCGTGDMAVEILRQSPHSSVIGIDPARKMLEIARKKADRSGVANSISFQAADATELPFPKASFAGVISAFCIRNIPDKGRAFREMRRVLTPSGRVIVLELTTPDNPIIRLGHKLYNRRFVPLAGRLIAGSADAYQYLVDSVEVFSVVSDIPGMMNDANFSETKCVRFLGGTVSMFIGRTM